jgi:hypothetical protein
VLTMAMNYGFEALKRTPLLVASSFLPCQGRSDEAISRTCSYVWSGLRIRFSCWPMM